MSLQEKLGYATTPTGLHIAYADIGEGSDFRFEDRGTHELKGVPGRWTLFEALG